MPPPPGLTGMNGFPPYQIISSAKRTERNDRIPMDLRIGSAEGIAGSVLDFPETCGALSTPEMNITSDYDATDLLEGIRTGHLNCRSALAAFYKRTMVATQVTNCLSECFIQEAFRRAEYLDNYFQIHGHGVGPLHGLPIAVDDNFNIKGVDSAQGLSARAFQHAENNSHIIDLLLSLGAVFFVKTTVPQSMLIPETESCLYGKTRNPYDPSFTASGGCGGLGALLAMRGSLFGLGLNVNGSIRLSAFCNGLYAVTPSSGRIPTRNVQGYVGSGIQNLNFPGGIGVMGVSLRDCETFFRVLSAAQPWLADPTASYLPWREPDLPNNLVIGIITGEPDMKVLPPLQRILEGVTKKLKDAGQEVVDVELFKCAEVKDLAGRLLAPDGGMTFRQSRASMREPLIWSGLYGGYLPTGTPPSASEILSNSLALENLQQEWLTHWASTSRRSLCGRPMDAIICPPQSFLPRPSHIMVESVFPKFWDILDYSVSMVRCGTVERAVDNVALPTPELALDAPVQLLYSDGMRGIYEGFPLGIQVVTPRQREEQCLAIAQYIHRLVGSSLDYPQAEGRGGQAPSGAQTPKPVQPPNGVQTPNGAQNPNGVELAN